MCAGTTRYGSPADELDDPWLCGIGESGLGVITVGDVPNLHDRISSGRAQPPLTQGSVFCAVLTLGSGLRWLLPVAAPATFVDSRREAPGYRELPPHT